MVAHARRCQAPPFEIYRQLRVVNPSPYLYYVDLGDFQVLPLLPYDTIRAEAA